MQSFRAYLSGTILQDDVDIIVVFEIMMKFHNVIMPQVSVYVDFSFDLKQKKVFLDASKLSLNQFYRKQRRFGRKKTGVIFKHIL